MGKGWGRALSSRHADHTYHTGGSTWIPECSRLLLTRRIPLQHRHPKVFTFGGISRLQIFLNSPWDLNGLLVYSWIALPCMCFSPSIFHFSSNAKPTYPFSVRAQAYSKDLTSFTRHKKLLHRVPSTLYILHQCVAQPMLSSAGNSSLSKAWSCIARAANYLSKCQYLIHHPLAISNPSRQYCELQWGFSMYSLRLNPTWPP